MFVESAINPGRAVPSPFAVQPDSLHALFSKLPAENLSAGKILFLEGDAATSVFEVLEGSLRIFRILGDGRRVITGFLNAGDILGLSFRSHYIYTAEAITPVTVRRLSRKVFEAEVANSAELRPVVFNQMSDEMAAAQDQMVLLSTKNAEERLCSFLLKELQRALKAGAVQPLVHLAMTRLDIADYLGLTIETVSRTMTKLSSKGVISTSGRHSVKVLKRGLLAQLAGDGDECEDGWRPAVAHGERLRH
ncbi:Crp/Fnr family transcriptional regulator [Pseudorhizobium endolithicum]|uniref:Crp/Fnr family transcriptional regulator n=1 Tax=Pseudorhizobium endolithicum TaxID=1191678 RepID=A0ABN7JPA6_9HYPH|nr:helix-turn-helix domain-containing protein [Pseudorhizobium endolithicum]CAD6425785.1 Crp/Fnr family transcriptional regulator [Rhizobium sp. Q54]CAD7034161.1 Crp/Fnr family transcriptional regulator [Pseudorhizobium endolithicum]